VEDLEAALKYGRGRADVYFTGVGSKEPEAVSFSSDLHCPVCDIHYSDPAANLFSFNSPIGACPTCRGFGRTIGIDYNLVVPDETKTLAQGAVKPWQTKSYNECHHDMMRFADKRGIPVDIPWKKLREEHKRWVLEGEGEWEDGKWYGAKRFFDWLETKSYRMHIRVLLSKYRMYRQCPDCKGARLKPEALLWRVGDDPGYTVHDVMLMPIDRCYEFFDKLKLPGSLDEAVALLLRDICSRLKYLVEVGLGYLALDRQSRTLSGGEVQRINLTTALGTSLVDTLFVLDEPSIGLHPRDIRRLIRVLYRLRDSGNTLLVVEHDPDVIRAADLVIDMGPGPGERGGEVVFFGSLDEMFFPRRSKKHNAESPVSLMSRSLTARYLSGEKSVFPAEESPDTQNVGDREKAGTGGRLVEKGSDGLDTDHSAIMILGAGEHNLKDIDVRIPLGRLVCITGVSGSGKSTLVQDVLYNAMRKLKNRPVETPGSHRAIHGHELIDDVVLVDQSPIGRTTRSNPASYVGALDRIRKLFSEEPLSKQRAYTPGMFSFNSVKGRCNTCGGSGFEHIEMQFLSDVYLRCPDCNGRRYKKEVLDVKLLPSAWAGGRKGEPPGGSEAKSIADVLDMTVNEACLFFSEAPGVLKALEPLRAVGLDYISLGQPVPTLSGGEAQRLKLAGHLVRSGETLRKGERLLFLLDEPTTGLHFDDIATLLRALRQLLVSGHSIVVIEHNIDVIRSADWIIDLGPEGGERGGEVVCVGPPHDVARCIQSRTGKVLAQLMDKADKKTAYSTGNDRKVQSGPRATSAQYGSGRSVLIRRAREHNLRNIDAVIPRFMFTVITGVSGSGKSTLAFDILFSEGQRRYLESLNAYARQFVQPASRPDVDGVSGVPPTVAIEQRVSRGGRKSTVATMTEIYHFLRLLFVKLGTQYCPGCKVAGAASCPSCYQP
jgi:excinuclease ABC subunit A